MAEPHSTRDRNRAIRQDALREQLQAVGLVQQVIERTKKLDADMSLDATRISAIKAANDATLRLLAKILPDLKAVEISQDPDNPVFKDERTLDSTLSRLIETVASAEGRVAAAATGKGPVH